MDLVDNMPDTGYGTATIPRGSAVKSLPGLRLKRRIVSTTDEVEKMIADNCPVAIGVSGGKDSSAVAFATVAYLREKGHTGPVLLIHSDLGRTEWRDSLPTCERLAKALGVELIVVRRKAGDMLARWQGRWRANRKRWLELSCVKLILPWSTPAMRFCTAELKRDVICSYLAQRFRGQRILNVTGIRRDESTQRAKKPVTQEEGKLANKTAGTYGLTWNSIIDWPLADVFEYLDEMRFELHEGYTKYGSTRISCVYCMMATTSDQQAAAKDDRNHDVGRAMVDLEIESTFAFQNDHWLGDTLDNIITPEQRDGLAQAKARAEARQAAEAKIPKHMLYVKGWPTCIPTIEEATLLAAVRFAVADAVGLPATFVNPRQIIDRYAQLMAEKQAREEKKKRRKS